eukprot:908478-Rhodomonas_salina.2
MLGGVEAELEGWRDDDRPIADLADNALLSSTPYFYGTHLGGSNGDRLRQHLEDRLEPDSLQPRISQLKPPTRLVLQAGS